MKNKEISLYVGEKNNILFGVSKTCTGHNHAAPCFIYFQPEEKQFSRVLSMLERPLAIQIKKQSIGYKRDPSILIGTNNYILNHINQNMMKTICQRMNIGLVYKNPTILILQYENSKRNSIRRNNGFNNNPLFVQRANRVKFLRRLGIGK
uniref:Uncharacterized protein n=1 Tax=Strongyloides stercoralis TaxID=6248 RepID=A0AAF5D3X0_STRER